MRPLASKKLASLVVLVAAAAALVHCGGGDDSGAPGGGGDDGGSDATIEAGGGDDAGADATTDAGADATTDAGIDATITDAGNDAHASDASDAATHDANDAGETTDANDAGQTADANDAGDMIDANDAGDMTDAADASDAADAADANDAAVPCDAAAQCGDAATAACCSGQCTDTARDPGNCGTCGNACGQAQFCNGKACNDAVFANVCANPAATVVWDSFDPDNDAGTAVAVTLHNLCTPPVSFAQQPNESLVVEPGTNRPILGVGNTYLIGGGWFGHPGIAYMDTQKLTKVQVNVDGNNVVIRVLATGTDIVNVPGSSLSPIHDYFVLEMAVEPVSGTLCLAATGMLAPGTTAAAWYASNVVIPNRAQYTESWYAYGWDDTDGNNAPSAGDTFTLEGHGK